MSNVITERETKLSKAGRLHKSNSGNWGLETTISAGGKYRHCNNFGTLEAAEAAANVHRAKGRKVKILEKITSKSGAKKHNVPAGKIYYQVFAYIGKSRQVCVMMTRQECLDAGVEPGSANN